MTKKKGSYNLRVRRLGPRPKPIIAEAGIFWMYAKWGEWEPFTGGFACWWDAKSHFYRYFQHDKAYEDVSFGLFNGSKLVRELT